MTNSRIFTGVEITVGGICSMPMDVVTLATTRSTKRNGRNKMAPIWKPDFSSLSMYAGTTICMGASSLFCRRVVCEAEANSSRSLSRA